MRLIGLLCVVLLGTSGAHAQPAVQVTGAWARATAPRQDEGAVYMTLLAPAGDNLLSVETAEAGMAMLHQSTSGSGVAGMQDLDDLALPAGRPVKLAPRGTHIMLMGLKHPLKAGSTLALTLRFEKAGRVSESVPVLPIGASGP